MQHAPAFRDDEIFHTLALTFLPDFGLKRQHDVLRHFGSAEAFFKTAARQRTLGAGPASGRTQALRRAEEEWTFAMKNGLHLCCIGSPDYPPLLSDCPDAPLVLFVKSRVPPSDAAHALRRPALGIVGTRNASLYGRDQTDRLLCELRADPISTVSGLAIGIDTQAHRSSLRYGLPTIAVLGHGLDRVYPPSNTDLANEIIAAGGALVSEMPAGTQVQAGLFPRRNRIIAGLSQAVVVAEASVKGGALITARLAHSYNRCLFAFPGKNDMHFSRGCNTLIKTQMAQLLESADDLRAEVNWTWGAAERRPTTAENPPVTSPAPVASPAPPSRQPAATPPHLNDRQRALLQIVRRENPAAVAYLCAETGRPLPDLLPDLLALELAHCIQSIPGNRYIAL